MTTRTLQTYSTVVIAAMLISLAAMAQDIKSFRATTINGDAQIKIGNAAPAAMELNKDYPFGATVQTGRNSFVDIEMSANNTFRLLARTRLEISEDTKNPKFKRLRLDAGQVEVKLDNFPKDHKLQVETPTAVCGAVGTRFVVEFENDENETVAAQKKGSRESRFECEQGEVYVASRFQIDGEPVQGQTMDVGEMSAGSSMVAVIHEGVENTYTDITVNRGKLTFAYGGEGGTELVAQGGSNGGTRFVCALEKTDDETQVAAMEVKQGEVINVKRSKRLFGGAKVENTPITVANGPVVVSKSEVYANEDGVTVVRDYIAAAKKEGELHSEIVDIQTAGGEPTAAQTAALRQAAGDATKLRQQLLARNTIRQIQQIKRSTNVPRLP